MKVALVQITCTVKTRVGIVSPTSVPFTLPCARLDTACPFARTSNSLAHGGDGRLASSQDGGAVANQVAYGGNSSVAHCLPISFTIATGVQTAVPLEHVALLGKIFCVLPKLPPSRGREFDPF